MKKLLLLLPLCLALGLLLFLKNSVLKSPISGAPPYGEPETQAPPLDELSYLKNWKRPDGPVKVALQVGHWKNDGVPDELVRLKGNTGASAAGKDEWEVNLAIAEETRKILEKKNITVEILPATVPHDYYADAFVAIHADGSDNLEKRGFKVASPWRDFSGNSGKLREEIEKAYQKATDFEIDPNITRNMRGYYAFSWWRYDHAVFPLTPSVIIETGFLTNYQDRRTIVDNPEISALGLSEGIMNYLRGENLLSSK